MEDKVDEWHSHEALDRTYICKTLMTMSLLDHPFVNHPSNNDVKSLVDKILSLLEDLNQLIGERRFL